MDSGQNTETITMLRGNYKVVDSFYNILWADGDEGEMKYGPNSFPSHSFILADFGHSVSQLGKCFAELWLPPFSK